MNSKCYAFLFWLISAMFFAIADTNQTDILHYSMGVTRPVLFRSEFLRDYNFKRFNVYALKNRSLYTRQGALKIPKNKVLYQRKLNPLTDTKLAQAKYYRSEIIKDFSNEVRANPKYWKSKLDSDCFTRYMKGSTTARPVGINGQTYDVHHGVDNSYYLVEHSHHGQYKHDGGNPKWGRKFADRVTNADMRRMTAHRWGKMMTLDALFSNGIMWLQGERDVTTYAVRNSAIVGAGVMAWGTESLLVSTYPLLQGGNPYFWGRGIWINLGGWASWIATAVYIGTQYAIMSGWEVYQLEQKRRVEELCRASDREAFRQILKKHIDANTSTLQELKVQ